MSFPTAAELADFQGLIPWLAEGAWKTDFEPKALIRDHGIRVASMVLKEECPEIEEFDDSCEFLIDAQVKGSAPRPYRTRLYFFSDYDSQARTMGIELETECTCFQGVGCQHAVAVLENLKAIATAAPQVPARQVNAALAAWLRNITEAQSLKPAARKTVTPYNKFLAYCIEPHVDRYAHNKEHLLFTPRLGNHHKTGFYIESTAAVADPSRPTKYMAAEDTLSHLLAPLQ